MCGIFCAFAKLENEETLLKLHKSCEFYINRRGPDFQNTHKIVLPEEGIVFLFSASVLWLQGQNLVEQPVVRENSVFLFNGDVFGGISESDRCMSGDTDLLLNQIESSDGISKILSKIKGPYAFVYFNRAKLRLYFGCDVYGRRSLLCGRRRDAMVLSSVAIKNNILNFDEVPPIGTFCVDLKLQKVSLLPWPFKNNNFNVRLDRMKSALQCTVEVNNKFPLEKPLKFRQPSEGDLKVFKEIQLEQSKCPFEILLRDEGFSKNVLTLEKLLGKSVEIRISNQPKFCQECIVQKINCGHATIGMLFSGGVDCTILAVLVDKFYDYNRPIDLLNVAFDRGTGYDVPDRESGKQSLEELKRLCPNRTFNFVEVNVTQEELNKERTNHIKHLIYPLNRILDDSLGCALWFAARGVGEDYTTSCRVLLVGMGADELFGGYCKQRAYFKKYGWQALYDSLNEDWQNISQKNLARDDRVISDHGRQLRTPYLDEDVVEFARNLNPWEKTYPSDTFPRGLGEKILLRTLAYKLGLREASSLKKRALQFGSRIAYSKENAFDVSPRL